jgi:hypothetical protein
MKNKFQLALLFALCLALLLPATALARDVGEDKIVFGGTYTLESGEVLNGNLIIFGGAVSLEEGSVVRGDVVLFGGSLDAQGEVTGSVIGIGGLVDLGATALVAKDVVSLGANLDQSAGAIVEGQITPGFSGPLTFDFPQAASFPRLNVSVNPFFALMWFALRAFLWAAVAVILALILPRQLDAVSNAAVGQPLIAGGLGLLTAVIAPLILILLLVTICLSPLSFIGFLILLVAWGLGLIALGLELGQRMAIMFKRDWAPALSAGVGTLLLILVLNGLSELIPCVGWLFPAIAGCVGLGAVLLTRFGTQPYRISAPPPPPTAPQPVEDVLPPLPEPPQEEVLPPTS